LSIDPSSRDYPAASPYSAFNGNPLFYIDPTGRDGVGYWETTGKTRTLVIKADYHFIKGQFDENILSAVKAEYGTYKKVDYNGEKINVRFEISFIPHEEGTSLDNYDGSNGQNRLVNETISSGPEFDLSHRQKVGVDVVKINNYVPKMKGIESIPLSSEDTKALMISVIAHGIGHNLGMIHADQDLMDDQNVFFVPLENPVTKKVIYKTDFIPNHVTKGNAQKLTNRVDEMSTQGLDFWKGKLENDGKTPLKDSGTVQIKR